MIVLDGVSNDEEEEEEETLEWAPLGRLGWSTDFAKELSCWAHWSSPEVVVVAAAANAAAATVDEAAAAAAPVGEAAAAAAAWSYESVALLEQVGAYVFPEDGQEEEEMEE